jgi:hypothetical protein
MVEAVGVKRKHLLLVAMIAMLIAQPILGHLSLLAYTTPRSLRPAMASAL